MTLKEPLSLKELIIQKGFSFVRSTRQTTSLDIYLLIEVEGSKKVKPTSADAPKKREDVVVVLKVRVNTGDVQED